MVYASRRSRQISYYASLLVVCILIYLNLPRRFSSPNISYNLVSSIVELAPSGQSVSEEKSEEIKPPSSSSQLNVYRKQCNWFAEQNSLRPDIDMSEVTEMLPFDNLPGGAWKQGFEISYNSSQWSGKKKLHVIIMPHSHNDPGWLMTFDRYFTTQSRNILNTIVEALSEKKSRKFIWAETSFLEKWWKQADAAMRSKMRELIVSKQLEIANGGWVMTDEASPHYYAMIEQMIEGHEWLKANIDESIRPMYSWSNDPFGYGSTMPYLLKQMGFKGLTIHRIHYHLKKVFAQANNLEFHWQQSWSTSKSKDTSIQTHVTPFVSYGIPFQCGPDPSICCQFDFKGLDPNYGRMTGCNHQEVNEKNLKERAQVILDQYRKKSQLYGDGTNHDVVLIPLGEDFRYETLKEARFQYESYERLIEYMNSNEEMNVNIQFGTLKDYFEVLERVNCENKVKVKKLTGDFFTYNDKDHEYWSGYFTSRPFYKQLDRIVSHYLRSAEIVFSLSNIAQVKSEKKLNNETELYGKMLEARRNLALFQHHDAITGTSKPDVVKDYADKLYKALRNTKEIIEQSSSYLLSSQYSSDRMLELDDVIIEGTSVTIELDDNNKEHKVVLFNPTLNKRVELVSFRVNKQNIEVTCTKTGLSVSNVQVSLVWSNTDGTVLKSLYPTKDQYSFSEFEMNKYELLFQVEIEPLSYGSYIIKLGKENIPLTQVDYYYNKAASSNSSKSKPIDETLKKLIEAKSVPIKFKEIENADEILKLATGTDYEAHFSLSTGQLVKLASSSETVDIKVSFVTYGAIMSGMYIFMPDGPAKQLEYSSKHLWTRVETSSDRALRVRVCSHLTIALHCVEFYPQVNKVKKNTVPHIHLWNVVDVKPFHNTELVMLVTTSVNNNDAIHTDQSGFQYIKRRRYEKFKIGGNVFPMASGAFIQDSKLRFGLVSGQPHGVASMVNSQIQVFLDRRLNQDDGRGLSSPVDDNLPVSSRFILYFERVKSEDTNAPKSWSKFPSLESSRLSHELLYPLIKLKVIKQASSFADKSFLSKSPPCDLHLVNLRTMQAGKEKEEPGKGDIGLILFRMPNEASCESIKSYVEASPYTKSICDAHSEDFKFENLIDPENKLNIKIKNTILTLAADSELAVYEKSSVVLDTIQPMQIEAFRLKIE